MESDSEELKIPKKKLIIEETPISPEEFIMQPKKRGTKKNVVLKGNAKTKKTKKLLIVESESK